MRNKYQILINEILTKNRYATLSEISNKINISIKDTEQVLKQNHKLFCKSLIIHEDGEDIYQLNTFGNKIGDAWAAWRHLCYLKY